MHEKRYLFDPKYIAFEKNVLLRFQVLNGLFLALPFRDVDQAGARLSIFSKRCEDGLNEGLTPTEIVNNYLARVNIPEERRLELLFKFLQFIERQVVLFDVLEDVAFNQVNDVSGVGSVEYLFNHIYSEESTKLELLDELLHSYKVRVVLTAHPTQFYPVSILGIAVDMNSAIQNTNLSEIRNLFLQMGLTRFNNKVKPTPIDEANSLIWYLEKVFYPNLFQIQKKLSSETVNLEIGFWPGGDRDGNPFVTADVSLKVAKLLRESIYRMYKSDIKKLKHRLTFDGVNETLLGIVERVNGEKYTNVNDLIDDLKSIRQILEERYHSLFIQMIDDVILKIKIFGFNFVKLDIRQNSAIHKKALTSLFKHNNIYADYLSLSHDAKKKCLKDNWDNKGLLSNLPDDEWVIEVLNTVRAIYQICKENGKAAIDRYIISNSASSIDVFEVMFFINLINQELKLKFNVPDKDLINIEIVPLFEMIDDLKNAANVMEELYQDPLYSAHLKLLENRQTIMVGFSDGTKDGGYLMANWSIYLAKKALTSLAKRYDIKVVFFDGRGGPPARGGGNTAEFYHAQGSKVASDEIHLTIQGQTVSSNFGTKDTAVYNFEQLVTSGLTGKLFPSKIEEITDEEEALITELAQACYESYLDLRHDELFIPYLEEITPLKYLSEVNVGSRPAKRTSDSKLKLEDLRAIPFVGAWMQMKQNILGYYGLGEGLTKLIAKDLSYAAKFKTLYVESLFFRTLIDNSMQSLSKTNFEITKYLADDPKFSRFWLRLKNESELTKSMILQISGSEQLLESSPVKRESIEFRNQILLPLLIIQQYALRAIRDESVENKEAMIKLIKKSLAANVNATRNAV